MNNKLWAVLALALLAGNANAGSVVVAANSNVGPMDAEAVRRVFLGRESSLGGAPVHVIYQKDGAVRSEFDKSVLGRSGAELTTYWSRLIFTGKAKAPAERNGDAAVKAEVAGTRGAIGYISDASVDATVKVLYDY